MQTRNSRINQYANEGFCLSELGVDRGAETPSLPPFRAPKRGCPMHALVVLSENSAPQGARPPLIIGNQQISGAPEAPENRGGIKRGAFLRVEPSPCLRRRFTSSYPI